MLYVIIGKNRDQTKTKRDELVSSLIESGKKENIPTTVVNLESTDFNINSEGSNTGGLELEQYLGGRGLFGDQYVVNISDLLKDKIAGSIVIDKSTAMEQSVNHFIIREETIDAATKKLLTKFATEVFDLDKSSGNPEAASSYKSKMKDFNIFTLTDALGNKDRKLAWLTYVKARELGNEPEQIFGTIWWFVKNLKLVNAKGTTSSNHGLNPFVYSKTKSALAHYSPTEITGMSKYLARIYHESHRGRADLAIELEKFVLGKF